MDYNVAAGDLPPGDVPKCGNRRDLPKSERSHVYLTLGRDVRNYFALGYVEGTVRACVRCGADRFERDKTDDR